MIAHALPSSSMKITKVHLNHDAELASRFFKSGDRAALDELFHRYANLAFRIALSEVGNAADAEDIVQAAFLQILVDTNREIQNVRGWIIKIVVNECRDKIKEEARRRKRNDLAIINQASTYTYDDERTETIAAAISAVKALQRDYRLPVWLHHLEGLPFKDIGHALSLPDEIVRKRASLGIDQIRQSLAAAGFTASMIAIPELLASSAVSEAPVTLTESIKAIVASAAAKGCGVTTGAASASAKGAAAATSTKAGVTAALLLAVMAATLTVFHARNGSRNEPKEDAGTPAMASSSPATKGVDPRNPIDKPMSEILNKEIAVFYRREYLSEILNDLNMQAGLRSVFPKSIDSTFMYTREEKQTTVRQVLEYLAAAGELELEYHANEVVFWKRASDATLAASEKKLTEGNVEARCKAVYDLAGLGDKRIYPLLFRALKDADGAVVAKAVNELSLQHGESFYYGDKVLEAVDPLLKLLTKPNFVDYRRQVIRELAQTREPRAVEALISLLKDADPNLRCTVAESLGHTRDPRAREALIALLKDTDANVRCSAALAMGHTGDPLAVEPLIALLKDADPNLRCTVAESLGHTRDPRAREALIALLKDSDANMRLYAAVALCRKQEPRIVEPFIELLKDPDANVQSYTAEAWVQTRDPRAVEAVITRCKDLGAVERLKLARAIGLTRDPRAVELLIASSKDSNPMVRAIWAQSLGLQRDPRAFERLIALLKDTDRNVRFCAVRALGQTRDPRAVCELISLLKNPDANLRSCGAQALGLTQDPRAVESLIALFKDADQNVRLTAALASGRTRVPSTVELLIALLKDTDPNVRACAAQALGQTGDPRTVELLIALFKDANANVRSCAAEALGQMKDSGLVELLIALLKDADANARSCAAQALSGTEDPRAVELLIKLFKDTDANVRSHAAHHCYCGDLPPFYVPVVMRVFPKHPHDPAAPSLSASVALTS